MSIQIGTSGWSYNHWKGCFYPADLPKGRWFQYYTQYFNTVEVNATFYRRFKDSTYQKWYEHSPDGFRYVLKAPRLITHRHYLKDVSDLITEFSHSASLLGDKLGLILLQLPPNMPYKPERLTAALSGFTLPSQVAVEFRHDRWLTDEVFTILEKFRATYCNPDYPNHALTRILTGQYGYLRLHGRRQWYADKYTSDELSKIAQMAKGLIAEGAQEVFIFFNNDYAGYAPTNARELRAILHA